MQDLENDPRLLLIAFPKKEGELKDMLTKTFQKVKEFVQASIKKKYGRIIFLIAEQANGIGFDPDKDNDNALFYAMQGGLVGFSKTITKEYSKKNIFSNVIYINWQETNLEQVAKLIKFTLNESIDDLRGQVFALDQGKWL